MVNAQELENQLSLLEEKEIILSPKLDTIPLSSYILVPESIVLSKPIPYEIDWQHSLFIEKENTNSSDTLMVQFRYLPIPLYAKTNQLKTYEDPGYDTTAYELFIMNSQEKNTFDFDNLNIQGNVGRGLNFGNTQNLVVNSNLNLRMSGMVAGDVEVTGVLTDRNVPFQPQGDSRQIQEIDKVLLQFKKNQHQISLGDYEYRKPDSYFLIVNKRLQGMNYSGINTINKWKNSSQVNIAASRGNYTRNSFVGAEGNQGPYKLYGANNESFIIILAGTERVYIDGLAQERGRDRDYIIDYNSGEITFTRNVLITNRSRISVEFEYKNQNYTNTLLNAEASMRKNKLGFVFNIYSQQDSKNRASFADTTVNTSGLFSNIGDNSNDFFIDSYERQSYKEDAIQYKLVLDSLVNGTNYDSLFVYTSKEQDELYRVIFTFVGQGNGDYELSNQSLNGRVYEWVAPNQGVSQGSYIAKLRLTPPTQQQMFGLTTTYEFSPYHQISLETSLSNRDLNTLSTIGNEDNQGIAAHLHWQNTQFLNKDDSSKHKMILNLNFEQKGANFRAIERYRPVEFSRDWNINSQREDSLAETWGVFQINYLPNLKHNLSYGLSYFGQNDGYKGIKQIANYSADVNGYLLAVDMDYLRSNEPEQTSTFVRPKFRISKQINALRGIELGFRADQNERKLTNTTTGLLQATSISDRDFAFFFESPDSSLIPLRFEIGKHFDRNPVGTELIDIFEANQFKITGSLNKIKNQKLFWTLTYRDLIVVDTTLTDQKDKNSLLGKINYNGQFFQGFIKTGFDYEIGSGREPKREFSYIKVQNGEGNYIWNDYNTNNLQEINEFEISPYSDQANYIRVFTNSNEYINADQGQLNQWLQIDPIQILGPQATSWKGFVNRFSINSTLSLNNKLYEDAPGSRFFPYLFDISKEGLISSNQRWSNRLIYNKLSQKFRMNYVYKINDSKIQLLSGFEEKGLNEQSVSADFFLKQKFNVSAEIGYGAKSYLSENYIDKNYDFDFYRLQPKISWIYEQQFRVGSYYQLQKGMNDLVLGGQESTIHSGKLDFNWNKKSQFSLQGFFEFNQVQFSGENNSAVGFAMLNGLQSGRNLLWNVNFEREVFKALKVNLIYDGRQLGDFDPVHTGRARITATF